MIVGWFLNVLASVVQWLLSLFPPVPVPDWASTSGGYLSSVLGVLSGLGVWFPWSLAGTVAAAVFATAAAGFTIKVVRIIASFLTLGGGSAA